MPNAQNANAQAAFALFDANGVPRKAGTAANQILVLDASGKVATANLYVDVAGGVAGLDGNGDLVRTIKILTGLAANLAGLVPVANQLVYATDTRKLVVGDGVTTFANLSGVGATLIYDPTTPGYYLDPATKNARGVNALDLNAANGATNWQGAFGNMSVAAGTSVAAANNSTAVGGGFAGTFFSFQFTVSGNNLVISGDVTGAGDFSFSNRHLLCWGLSGGGTMPIATILLTTGAATFAGGNTTIPVSSVAPLGGATAGTVVDMDGRAGTYCFVSGFNSSACGLASTALGNTCISIGGGSLAAGRRSNAWGLYSMALGQNNGAWSTGSIAVGVGAQGIGQGGMAQGAAAYSGIYATAQGNGVHAGPTYSFAQGQSNQVGMPANVSWNIISSTQLQTTGDYTREINQGDTLYGWSFTGGLKNLIYAGTIGVTAIDYNVTAAGKTTITTSNNLGTDRTSVSLINTSGPQNARATGFGSMARRWCERVHAAGQWAQIGDIQEHNVILYGQAASTAALELTLDGYPPTQKTSQNSCNRFILQAPRVGVNSRAIVYDVVLCSSSSLNNGSGAWRGTIHVKMYNDTVTVINQSWTAITVSPAGSTVQVVADNGTTNGVPNRALKLLVTPGTATDTLWYASLRGVEITY